MFFFWNVEEQSEAAFAEFELIRYSENCNTNRGYKTEEDRWLTRLRRYLKFFHGRKTASGWPITREKFILWAHRDPRPTIRSITTYLQTIEAARLATHHLFAPHFPTLDNHPLPLHPEVKNTLSYFERKLAENPTATTADKTGNSNTKPSGSNVNANNSSTDKTRNSTTAQVNTKGAKPSGSTDKTSRSTVNKSCDTSKPTSSNHAKSTSSTTKAGSSTMKANSSAGKAGSSTMKANSSADNAGSSAMETSSSTDQAGSSAMQTSSSTDKAGCSTVQTSGTTVKANTHIHPASSTAGKDRTKDRPDSEHKTSKTTTPTDHPPDPKPQKLILTFKTPNLPEKAASTTSTTTSPQAPTKPPPKKSASVPNHPASVSAPLSLKHLNKIKKKKAPQAVSSGEKLKHNLPATSQNSPVPHTESSSRNNRAPQSTTPADVIDLSHIFAAVDSSGDDNLPLSRRSPSPKKKKKKKNNTNNSNNNNNNSNKNNNNKPIPINSSPKTSRRLSGSSDDCPLALLPTPPSQRKKIKTSHHHHQSSGQEPVPSEKPDAKVAEPPIYDQIQVFTDSRIPELRAQIFEALRRDHRSESI